MPNPIKNRRKVYPKKVVAGVIDGIPPIGFIAIAVSDATTDA